MLKIGSWYKDNNNAELYCLFRGACRCCFICWGPPGLMYRKLADCEDKNNLKDFPCLKFIREQYQAYKMYYDQLKELDCGEDLYQP